MANQPINVTYDFRSGAVTDNIAVGPTDLVNKSQIESMIVGNISAKASVKIHAHGNVDLAQGGLLSFDNYQLQESDRVIVTDQTDPVENGIYVASSGQWTRALDADESVELKPYTYVYVTEGDHAGRKFQLINSTNPVVDTDPQNWDVVPIPANEATNTTIDTSSMVINATNVEAAIAALDSTLDTTGNFTSSTSNRLTSVVGTPNGTLGSFVGSLIPDNETVINALQALETALEDTIYTATTNKYISPLNIVIPNNLWTTVTHNLSTEYPSSVQMFDADDSYTHATHAFRWRPKAGSTTDIEIFQDSGVNRNIKVVAHR